MPYPVNDVQSMAMPTMAESPRLRSLPVYTHQYSRTINFSDLNVADHLDSAVLCRYIADATAAFWIDVLELPPGYEKSLTEWVAHVSGYQAKGVQHAVIANLEQHLRYVGEGFRLEKVYIDITIRSVSNTSCVLALHLFVERPRPDNDQIIKRHTLAIAEITSVMLDPVKHRIIPFTPEMHAYMAKGMPSSGRHTQSNSILKGRL